MTPRQSAKQSARWRVFVVVAVVHVVGLPLLFDARSHDVVAVVAGGLYLALAAADWWVGRRRASRST